MMNAVLLVLELFTVFTQYAVCSKLCRKRKRTKYFGAAVWAAFFVSFNVLTPVYNFFKNKDTNPCSLLYN